VPMEDRDTKGDIYEYIPKTVEVWAFEKSVRHLCWSITAISL